MDVWQSLDDWQKLLIGALASCAIYYAIMRTTRSARDAVTRLLNRNQPALPHYVAAVADDGIRITRPDGSADFVALSNLRKVLVTTNDRGPGDYDVWFVLEGNKDALEFPLETHGLDDVLKLLKQLPGFELRGMNSAVNATFECWPNPLTEAT